MPRWRALAPPRHRHRATRQHIVRARYNACSTGDNRGWPARTMNERTNELHVDAEAIRLGGRSGQCGRPTLGNIADHRRAVKAYGERFRADATSEPEEPAVDSSGT